MVNELKGAVVARFGTITAFASAAKWDRKKASRIVNHVQAPLAHDMETMAELLEVNDGDTFVRLFLPRVSTMWNRRG